MENQVSNKFMAIAYGTDDRELLEITDWGKNQFVLIAAGESDMLWKEYWLEYHKKLEAWKNKRMLEAVTDAMNEAERK
jgi:hypothetical protein